MGGPPEDPGYISFQNGQEEAEGQAKELCIRLLPGWNGLDPKDLEVSKISGGISNLLLKVAPPAGARGLGPVAVKIFGDKTELLIDREAERGLLLQLNAAGFGAPVVGLFGNGRVEAFLTAATLTPEQVGDPRVTAAVAARLRAFHALRPDLPGQCPPQGQPPRPPPSPSGQQDPQHPQPQQQQQQPQQHHTCQWSTLDGWLDMAATLDFSASPAKAAAFARVDLAAVRSELAALRAACRRTAPPRVLCHNDLLPGNILVVQYGSEEAQAQARAQGGAQAGAAAVASDGPSPQAAAGLPAADSSSATDGGVGGGGSGSSGGSSPHVLDGGALQFIDFEYSGYGHRGFDFGNHFNEYAGFDCDYSRFPGPEQRRAFLRAYLGQEELERLARQEAAAAAASSTDGSGAAAAANEGGRAAGPGELAAAEARVLGRMDAEACVHALLSHAYWGVWSYVQARYSPIDFDYLAYAELRWAEYHRRKAEFFALADAAFPAPAAAPAAAPA